MIQRIQNDDPHDLQFSMYLGLSSIKANEKHDQSDHYDRIKNQIRTLQKENDNLKSELYGLKKNPSQLIRNFQAKLMRRISQLRQQNEGIELLIQKSKMPGYCEMTKKKPYFASETPGKDLKRDESFGQERGNLLPQLQFSEKCELSTCQNFPIQHNVSSNPLRPLQPLQEHELQVRAQITSQLLQIIDRSAQITQEIDKISKQKHEPEKKLKIISQNRGKFDQIAKYKQRLVLLLRKLKIRQQNQEQIIRQYRKLHEQTYIKFKQATQLLNQISSVSGKSMQSKGDNIDDLYAEALQLEEKLKYINEQLERLDQNQWLKDIHNELVLALKRLGIQHPDQKSTGNSQQLKQRIDQLADILIECIANHKADEKQKLTLLKYYYEEEKENNKKIIKNLQNKEQGLSKKLIDMQLNN